MVRRLVHGVIAHGEEAVGSSGPPAPRAYFSPTSGGGRAIRAVQAGGSVDVGVIGLGVGTLAAYARTGDRFRFYELDPDVLHVARNNFSYLEHAAGTVEHVLGDARLSMERELGTERQGRFDVLVLDAFSSDAIPVHLLTREALQLYLAQLKPGGLIAMHLSNKFLDLPARGGSPRSGGGPRRQVGGRPASCRLRGRAFAVGIDEARRGQLAAGDRQARKPASALRDCGVDGFLQQPVSCPARGQYGRSPLSCEVRQW